MQASENFHSGTVSGLGTRLNLKRMDSIRLQDFLPQLKIQINLTYVYLSYIMEGRLAVPVQP